MIRAAEIATALQGAVLLARGRREGLRYMDTSRAGALRSFWAAAIGLPAAIPLILLRHGYFPPRIDDTETLLVEAIAYAIGWTAFPVLAHLAARIADRAALFPRVVAAYNWTSLVQLGVLLIASPLALADILPAPLDTLLELALRLALLAYLAFTIRVALDLGWAAAIGLALVEFMLGLSVFRTVITLENAWPLPPGAA
jgi:hypothetical protein